MKRLLPLLAGLCLAFPVRGAGDDEEAPPGAPSASVTVGYGGALVPGWQPAVFTLWNPGAATLALRLSVEPLDQEEHPRQQVLRDLELPPRSRQRQVLYFQAWDGMGQVRLSARGGGRELLPERERLLGDVQEDALVALTGPSAGWIQGIREVTVPGPYGNQRTLSILAGDATSLPALPEGMGRLRAVLCSGFPLETLQPAQLDALLAWVQRGGHLILTDTPQGLPRILRERIPPLQGFVSGMLPEADLEAMAKAGGNPFPPHGIVPCLLGKPRGAAAQPFPNLGLTRFPWGFGHVTVLGIDPAIHPFRGWPGMTPLWTAALLSSSPPRWKEPWPAEGNPWGSSGGRNQDLVRPGLCTVLRSGLTRSFPVSIIAALVVAYLAAMALQFHLVRRFGNPAWAVAGIPAVVLLFTLGTLCAGYLTRGVGCSANLVTLRIALPGGGHVVRSCAALFSSFPGRYDIPLGEGALGGLVFPQRDALDDGFHTLRDGGGTRSLGDVPVRMWSARYLWASASRKQGTALAFREGRLVNTGIRPIPRLILLRQGVLSEAGPLAPGQALGALDGTTPPRTLSAAPLETALLESLRTGLDPGQSWALGVTDAPEGSLLTLPVPARAVAVDIVPLPSGGKE